MFKFTTLILPLLLPAISQAAGDQPYDPDVPAKAVAPYVDGQTIALVHVDLARVDIDAWVNEITEAGKLHARVLAPFRQMEGKWVAEFKKAGGKELYAVLSLADLPGAPFLIVPLPENADAEALAALLGGKKQADPPPSPPFLPRAGVIEKTDQALFAGSKVAWARIKGGKPAPRPEVAKAFAAAGDAAVQVLILPTADTRRVVEELMPTLPKMMGGGPSMILTHGLGWAALAVKGPPQAECRLTIQAEDAKAANHLRDLIAKSWQLLTEQIKQDPHVRADVKPLVAQLDKIAALLTPTVEEDRLSLTINFKDANVKNFLLAMGRPAAESADRINCMNKLKQLALAFHNYHDVKGSFPATASHDKDGKPLLSWRVHLLPFLEQLALYKEFHLDEPWDSEHNKKLIPRMPAVYRCPNLNPTLEGKTSYLAPVGDALMFTGTPRGVQIKEVTDGTSNTILLVDANDDHAVIWTKPDDLKIDPQNPVPALLGHHDGGTIVAFADGSIRLLPTTITAKTLYALFTRNGGEMIQPPH